MARSRILAGTITKGMLFEGGAGTLAGGDHGSVDWIAAPTHGPRESRLARLRGGRGQGRRRTPRLGAERAGGRDLGSGRDVRPRAQRAGASPDDGRAAARDAPPAGFAARAKQGAQGAALIAERARRRRARRSREAARNRAVVRERCWTTSCSSRRRSRTTASASSVPNVAREPRVLLAGVSTRAMAESAALAGYEVWSLDAFGDLDQHPGVRALSLPRDVGVPFTVDAVVRAAERIEADVVAYLSPFENHPAAVERLARGRTLWGNDASVLRRVREPGVVSRAAGVADPNRWLVKPRASGGGHGIRWWAPGNPVPAGSHVEPFIDGEPGSIVFVAAGRDLVPLGLTRQLVGDAVVRCERISLLRQHPPCHPHTRGIVAPARLGVRRSRRGRVVTANSTSSASTASTSSPATASRCPSRSTLAGRRRWSSSSARTGCRYSACTRPRARRASFRRSTSRERTRTRAVPGKAIVFARHDVTCGDTVAWLADSTVRDVPHPGEHIPAGRPVCTVFATARTRMRVTQASSPARIACTRPSSRGPACRHDATLDRRERHLPWLRLRVR